LVHIAVPVSEVFAMANTWPMMTSLRYDAAQADLHKAFHLETTVIRNIWLHVCPAEDVRMEKQLCIDFCGEYGASFGASKWNIESIRGHYVTSFMERRCDIRSNIIFQFQIPPL
jgi:hypothetical protein